MFCSSCGSEIPAGAAFCSKCGRPLGPVSTGTFTAPPAVAPVSASARGISDNAAGLLCWIPFVGIVADIVFLVAEPYKNDRFVRFHAVQSLFFVVACIVVSICIGIIDGIFGLVLPLSVFLVFAAILRAAFSIAALVISVYMMVQAYSGRRTELPFIGPLAARQ